MENLPSKMSNTIFKINDLVDLRLIDNTTYIYVNNEMFLTCVRLLMNIPVNRIQEADEINSIDEAAEIFNSTENWQNIISPEDEFKAHCSNIQAFFENGLNTDILASNIAFPLLKKLVDHEYKPAIQVFKEEIVRRFNDGTSNSRLFLYKEGYLNYLNEEEKQELKKHKVYLAKQELKKEELRYRKIIEKIREKRGSPLSIRCKKCEELFEVKYSQIDGKPLILCPKCFNFFQNQDLSEEEIEREREWLKKEYGENHELFESLQEKLKEMREVELIHITERQNKVEAETRYVTEGHPKLNELNWLNSHIGWGQIPGSSPFTNRIAEWIAGKIALRKVGRKNKKDR